MPLDERLGYKPPWTDEFMDREAGNFHKYGRSPTYPHVRGQAPRIECWTSDSPVSPRSWKGEVGAFPSINPEDLGAPPAWRRPDTKVHQKYPTKTSGFPREYTMPPVLLDEDLPEHRWKKMREVRLQDPKYDDDEYFEWPSPTRDPQRRFIKSEIVTVHKTDELVETLER